MGSARQRDSAKAACGKPTRRYGNDYDAVNTSAVLKTRPLHSRFCGTTASERDGDISSARQRANAGAAHEPTRRNANNYGAENTSAVLKHYYYTIGFVTPPRASADGYIDSAMPA